MVRLPFELAMVIWAFLGARGPIPTPPLEPRSVAITGAAIPMVSVMALGYLVFGWGGLLDVKEPDLVASLRVDCGAPGAGPPAEIPIEYDWSWSKSAAEPVEKVQSSPVTVPAPLTSSTRQ